ncbi:hypothetical protein EDB84DRAFT_1440766 [Lactarius hengduanensis]|nr:hypothetical protein EDB84DRAFT_1440766 [Lactarius hengduanensis]
MTKKGEILPSKESAFFECLVDVFEAGDTADYSKFMHDSLLDPQLAIAGVIAGHVRRDSRHDVCPIRPSAFDLFFKLDTVLAALAPPLIVHHQIFLSGGLDDLRNW